MNKDLPLGIDIEYELQTTKKIIKIYETELKKEREKRRQKNEYHRKRRRICAS